MKAGKLDIFGLEVSLEGLSLSHVDFHAKTWTKDLYEGEMSLGSEDGKTNFYFNLLLIPFNQEVVSKYFCIGIFCNNVKFFCLFSESFSYNKCCRNVYLIKIFISS